MRAKKLPILLVSFSSLIN